MREAICFAFYFDSIRIYDPAFNRSAAQAAYIEDKEAYPQFIQLRNRLIGQTAFSDDANVSGTVFIDAFGISGTIGNYANYEPNHEVYLKNGQSHSILNVQTEQRSPQYSSRQNP